MSVPAGTRFIGIQPGVDMVEKKSSQANSPTEVYSIEDIQSSSVPYTGATQDVDLGEYELKAGQIELDQSPTGTAGVAVTRWNNTAGVTETTLKGGSVVLKNGVDLVARVVNKVTPNATLTKADYKVVKISGAQGQRLAVDYAQANNDNNSADTLGVVIETIPTNQEGFIMTMGQLEEINTTGSLQGETWADGDVLYLSPTVPGNVTKVKPTGATGHIVVIGYVEYAHAVHGKIYVKIMNGWELDELHNVYIDNGTLANNQVLTYESATQLWKNKTPETGITVGTTSSSGTNGRVFFQAGGVIQQDANFTFDNTLKRLTLKAVGTAATDIPFAVQNSGGTRNNLTVNGAGLTTSNIDAPGSYVWTNHFQAVRFESGSPITNVNIKTNWPFVESFYIGRSTGTANNDASTASGIVYSHQGEFTVRNTVTSGYFGITLNANQNLTQRVGIDTGRTDFGDGWSLRNFTNSVDVINFQTNSPRVGIGWNNKGAALGAILDVKAQGALSTDIAFRVRNSADSADIFSVRGNGEMYIPQAVFNSTNTIYFAGTTDSIIRYSPTAIGSVAFGQGASITNATYYNTVIGSNSSTGASAGLAIALGYNSIVNSAGGIAIGDRARTSGADAIVIGTTGGVTQYSGTNSIHLGKKGNSGNNFTIDNVFLTYFNSDLSSTLIRANGSLGLLGQQAYIFQNGTGTYGVETFMGNGGNTLVVRNHTSIPSLNITDSFQQYSADITAGNAAPHFRTENGDIIKLYKETTAVTAATLVSGLGTPLTDTDTFDGYTLKQIVKALRNQGLLA